MLPSTERNKRYDPSYPNSICCRHLVRSMSSSQRAETSMILCPATFGLPMAEMKIPLPDRFIRRLRHCGPTVWAGQNSWPCRCHDAAGYFIAASKTTGCISLVRLFNILKGQSKSRKRRSERCTLEAAVEGALARRAEVGRQDSFALHVSRHS